MWRVAYDKLLVPLDVVFVRRSAAPLLGLLSWEDDGTSRGGAAMVERPRISHVMRTFGSGWTILTLENAQGQVGGFRWKRSERRACRLSLLTSLAARPC